MKLKLKHFISQLAFSNTCSVRKSSSRFLSHVKCVFFSSRHEKKFSTSRHEFFFTSRLGKKISISRSGNICSGSVFSTWTDIPLPQCLPTSTGRENKKQQPALCIATVKKTSTAVEEIPGKSYFYRQITGVLFALQIFMNHLLYCSAKLESE